MHHLINAYPLYNFLKYCNSTSFEKTILDCGAGGTNPPLSLFYEFGYHTHGIELYEDQLQKSAEFCRKNNMPLNIIKGDMLQIPYQAEAFPFLFSYNTSVHIRKEDFFMAMREFSRVLKPGGLCFVNFLSSDCDTYGKGEGIASGEFIQMEDGEEVLYSHYEESELAGYFRHFEIIYKEKRSVTRIIDGHSYTSGHYDYILKKMDSVS